jgi:hypothetical protein
VFDSDHIFNSALNRSPNKKMNDITIVKTLAEEKEDLEKDLALNKTRLNHINALSLTSVLLLQAGTMQILRTTCTWDYLWCSVLVRIGI